MINALLKGIFSLVIGLVNVLLSPIDALIAKVFPSIDYGLTAIGSFFDWVLGFIPWAISYFNFPQAFLTMFVGYMTFKYTVPLGVHTVKLAIKWYDKIKP
ncbi:MAG: hypothetical protein OSJ70_00650 [Bacilli bacterium]|nr:hypothetical protein [Bacilli bacterium]